MNKIILGVTFLSLAFNISAQEEPYLICGQDMANKYLKEQKPQVWEQLQKKQALLRAQATNFNYDENLRVNAAPIKIPLVVHVVYNSSTQNISDAQVLSQIDVLNKDYIRTNTDASKTPAAFQSIAGHPNFQFCLATKDPKGNPTNGIERIPTNTASFSPGDYSVKYASLGGADAWDPTQYLNIWVCNITGNVGGWGESATQNPPQETMGAVLRYDVFGTTGTLRSGYTLGRCATHEVGHCFDLTHIWGYDGQADCTDDDGINDTPKQSAVTFGTCPAFPKTDACSPNSPGIMYMNYMDYTYDACKNLFTKGQSALMTVSYNNSQTTFANSKACNLSTSINDPANTRFEGALTLYPNPTNGLFYLKFHNTQALEYTVSVCNALGQQIISNKTIANYSNPLQFDLTGFDRGIYYINVHSAEGDYHRQINLTQ